MYIYISCLIHFDDVVKTSGCAQTKHHCGTLNSLFPWFFPQSVMSSHGLPPNAHQSLLLALLSMSRGTYWTLQEASSAGPWGRATLNKKLEQSYIHIYHDICINNNIIIINLLLSSLSIASLLLSLSLLQLLS